jgi:hypothetical protein
VECIVDAEGGNAEPAKQHASRCEGSAARKGLAAWLMEIGHETAPLMDDGKTSKELMDELYDEETGLPK